MTTASQSNEARRKFLIQVHHQIWMAASRVMLPLIVASYAIHLVKHPCWQTITLFAGVLVFVACWYVGAGKVEKGDLDEGVSICAGSGILFVLLVVLLRKDAAVTSVMTLSTLFTYLAIFSNRALVQSVAATTVVFIGCLLVVHWGVVPQFEQSEQSKLIQNIVFAAIFFPVTAYFLRVGQQMNEALGRESQQADDRNAAILEAVAQVQPVLDQAIAELRPMADAFASTATQQASTSAQMGVTAQRVSQMVTEAARAAQGTRMATEQARDGAAQGREKLRAVEEAFDKSVKRIESVRAQIDELAAEVSHTERVNQAIHEIAKNLTIMGINASLEAARAGAAGVGFKVVASELGRLVAQTTADLHQANQILEHLRARAVVIAQDADASTLELHASYDRLVAASSLLEGITASFRATSKSVEDIAGAAEHQRTDIAEISGGIHDMVVVAGRLSDAGRSLRDGLGRVEGAHGQLREILARK